MLGKNWENCLHHPANPDRVRGANALAMDSKWNNQLNWPRGSSRKEAAMVLSSLSQFHRPCRRLKGKKHLLPWAVGG